MNSCLPEKVEQLVEVMGLLPHPEGGFFLETHRAGSSPYISRGQTDFNGTSLVETTDRADRRPDGNTKRNALTSMMWVPTKKSATLPVVCNLSDHVHFYQGGLPFQYHVYNPDSRTLRTAILGPDIRNGHSLQVVVRGGEYKCGSLLQNAAGTADYAIIAEAVAPGFDLHDFFFVSAAELKKTCPMAEALMTPFLHDEEVLVDFDGHYDRDEKQRERTKERT